MCSSVANAQVTAKKLLPRNINVPYLNQLAPSISGDGNHLVFLSDQVYSKRLNMMYAKRIGSERWSDPQVVTAIDNSFEINHLRGYSLSYDGNILFFTTLKSGGIGGYDIWLVRKNGNSWGQPENLGKPLNSAVHEGDPSLSADGKNLYFMRCEKMNMNEAENCTLYVSKKKNRTFWGEPVALPSNINTGNAVTPRILPDNESLYFSSNKPGGQGGYDLYLTRKQDESWTEPLALSFLNTTGDDRYVSLTAKGDIIFYSMKYKEKDKLVKAKIPDNFQPMKIYQMNGKVLQEQTHKPIEAYVQVFDIATQKLAVATKAPQNTGEFYLLLKGGKLYDLSVNPVDKSILFHSEIIDLQNLESSDFKRVDIKLQSINEANSFIASNISFETYTTNIQKSSMYELKRISLLLKNNPTFNIEIGTYLGEYKSDSVQTDPGLTEVEIDTLPNPAYLQFQQDSLLALTNDSRSFATSDTLNLNVGDSSLTEIADTAKVVIASLPQALDTLGIIPKPHPFIYKYTYHNDRTAGEAEAIYNYLIGIGVPENRLSYKGYGYIESLENTSTETMKSNWVEIKLYKN
ncbi:MAG: hypothetical protein AAGI07_19050 [Bacteroidota bacterium]